MKIIEYEKFLKEKVFRTDEYNQFNLLFEDIKKLNKQNFKHAVILERSICMIIGVYLFHYLTKKRN